MAAGGRPRVPHVAGMARAKFPARRSRPYAFTDRGPPGRATHRPEPRSAPYGAVRALPGRIRHGEGWPQVQRGPPWYLVDTPAAIRFHQGNAR